jgi:hypothetical protein
MSEWIDTSSHGLLLALNLDNMSEWIDTSTHGLLLALNLDNMSEWIDTSSQRNKYLFYSLFCANQGLKPTIYHTIPCFVPTQGSNLQSTALFPVLSQPRAQTYNLPHYSIVGLSPGLAQNRE